MCHDPEQLCVCNFCCRRSVLAGHGSCVLWRTCAPPKACSLRSIDAQSRPLLIALAQRDSCSPLACACSVPVAPFAPTGCAFCQGCKAGPAPSGASSMASSQHAELGSIPKVASTGTFLGMDTSHPLAAGSDVVHATGALPGAGPPYPCKEGEATEKLREVRKGRRVKGIAKAKAAMLDTGAGFCRRRCLSLRERQHQIPAQCSGCSHVCQLHGCRVRTDSSKFLVSRGGPGEGAARGAKFVPLVVSWLPGVLRTPVCLGSVGEKIYVRCDELVQGM